MTAATPALVPAPSAGRRRIAAVVRLNSVSAPGRMGMPWLVLTVAFLLNVMIFALVRANNDDTGGSTGALLALYSTVAAAHLSTMTQTFPFALSLGLTRRDFYLGTGLVVLGESVLYGVVLTGLLGVERATGGWGLNMRFFGPDLIVQDNVFAQIATYTGPLLALGFLGMLTGTVFKRWGQFGLYTAGIAVALVVAALVALVTWQQWWTQVGEYLGAAHLSVTAGYPALIALLAGVGGYLLIRRATP